jgi:hypothetical protein
VGGLYTIFNITFIRRRNGKKNGR